MVKSIVIAFVSGILSAFSQILLKKGSQNIYNKKYMEYLNRYVILGYFLTFLCMLMMVYAYRTLPLKYGSAMESLVYVYVVILSCLLFKEKISTKKKIGILTIVIGVIVFSII